MRFAPLASGLIALTACSTQSDVTVLEEGITGSALVDVSGAEFSVYAHHLADPERAEAAGRDVFISPLPPVMVVSKAGEQSLQQPDVVGATVAAEKFCALNDAKPTDGRLIEIVGSDDETISVWLFGGCAA